MADTNISWADKTWNPTVGCSRESAGCENCYAEQLAPRLASMGQAAYDGLTRKHADGSVNWTGEVRLLPERLKEPDRWQKPQRVFVDSMSDLFHPSVPDAYLDEVFRHMAKARRHTFMILTKRPKRMREYVSARWTQDPRRVLPEGLWGPLLNVWLGTSVENQEMADLRIPELLATPAAVRFISAEPLLGPLDITPWVDPATASIHYNLGKEPPSDDTMRALDEVGLALAKQFGPPRLDWVICGAESGDGRRPFDVDWARSLRDQCRAAGVAFFFKQGSARHPGQYTSLDGELCRAWPEARSTARVS